MKNFILIIILFFFTSCACQEKSVNSRALYTIDEDSLISLNLIENYGQRLDSTYNQEGPTGMWLLDVASEMDWQDLIKYIIELPDFQDSEWAELYDITHGRIEEARCDLP